MANVSISAIVYTKLTSITAVTNVVSTRIWPSALPVDATYPAIAYEIVSMNRVQGMGGAGGTGTASGRVQIRVWSTAKTDVETLATAIRVNLDMFSGTVSATEVKAVLMQNEFDQDERDASTGVTYYSKVQEYEFWIGESTS